MLDTVVAQFLIARMFGFVNPKKLSLKKFNFCQELFRFG